MKRIAVTALVLGLSTGPVAGCGNRTDPREILEAADAATRKLTSVSYASELSLTGDWPSLPESLHGTISVERAPLSGATDARPRERIEAYFSSNGSAERHLLLASDGRTAIAIDYTFERFRRGDPSLVAPLLGSVQTISLPEFVAAEPFTGELEGRSLTYEGVETVGDVECDVVSVEYDLEGAPRARWSFGREDSLPRRVARIANDWSYTVSIRDLEVDPVLDEAVFRPTPPEGFAESVPGVAP